MSYTVSKTFRFEAGHRVWNQELNTIEGVQFENKCRNIHGHSYEVEVKIDSLTLNNYGVVIDFTHIKYYMQQLIEKLDHAFIIDINDPLYETIKATNTKIFEVNFVPTAENLARFIYNYLKEYIPNVSEVIVYETKTSYAIYR